MGLFGVSLNLRFMKLLCSPSFLAVQALATVPCLRACSGKVFQSQVSYFFTPLEILRVEQHLLYLSCA